MYLVGNTHMYQNETKPVTTMITNQSYGASMCLVLLVALATSTHAALPLFDSLIDQINTSSEMQMAADSSSSTEEFLNHLHIVDSVLITVIAWLVVVNVSNLSPCLSMACCICNISHLRILTMPFIL